MQLSFHGVTKIEIFEYMVERGGEELKAPEVRRDSFKVVKIAITDRDNTHEVSVFVEREKLSVRKVERSEIMDSLVDRIIEVVPK